jgi:hypothetical protein
MAFSKSGPEPILVKRNWPRMYQTGWHTSFSSGLHAQIWVYQAVLEKLGIKVFNEKKYASHVVKNLRLVGLVHPIEHGAIVLCLEKPN